MNDKISMIQNLPRDSVLRAVQLVREMIEYRNAEISALSWNLKRGIVHLHRKQSSEQHAEQYKELKGIIDQISRHISDNDYDINHLHIFLTQCPEKPIYPVDPVDNAHDLHYIQ